MGRVHSCRCLAFGVALVLLSAGENVFAVTAQNVLVLYNDNSAAGIAIANYYAQVHPGVQLLGLSGVTTSEDVTADYYLNVIRPQILPALNSSIDEIVTTTGLPLRIDVTESNPGTYTDPFGVKRTVGSGWWKPYSSLESELTTINEVSTWQQMGDQTYYSQSGKPSFPQPSCNPYYNATTSFHYSNYNLPNYGGVRLTARLDGFTVANVESAIDRAQHAYLLPGSNSPYVVMDNDPNANTVDHSMIQQLKTNVIASSGLNYVYDNTTAAVTTTPGPVIGYDSNGTNGSGLSPGYIPNQLNFTLANGAVFDTHESYNAYSFQPGGNHGGQGLVAEWLAKGGTVGVGNVQEPSAGAPYEANESQMYKMLLAGYTWGEAAWSSIQQLGYVNTVVGDPLMTWKTLIPGDANMDGSVGSADLAVLAANWGKTGQAGGSMWSLGDFNCDGVVGSADLALLAADWGKTASWGTTTVVASGDTDQLQLQSFTTSIPEPSTLLLAAAGLLTILLRRGYKHLF